ncbi:hypothetical protein GCM10010359_09300 [Streptomyces morookaense]|nr:hypothetical protein GCM10010359_09300 [Streptomyces morookaense]
MTGSLRWFRSHQRTPVPPARQIDHGASARPGVRSGQPAAPVPRLRGQEPEPAEGRRAVPPAGPPLADPASDLRFPRPSHPAVPPCGRTGYCMITKKKTLLGILS